MQTTLEAKYFSVLEIDGKKRPAIYLGLEDVSSGEIFKATYAQSEDVYSSSGDLIEQDDYNLQAICSAFADNRPVNLSIATSRNDDGEIVRAIVLGAFS